MKKLCIVLTLALTLMPWTLRAEGGPAFFDWGDTSGDAAGVYASRQDIWSEMGIFKIDDLSYLLNCVTFEEDGLKAYGTYYPEDIVCHGTSGDMGYWLTAEGLMSDMDVDLDGDGMNEYLIIKWVDNGEGAAYGTPNAYACIYESVEGGYVMAAEIPLPGNNYAETEVWLVSNADKWYIAGDIIDRGDGGWCYTNVIVYEYDGQNAHVAMAAGVNNYDSGVIVEANDDFTGTYEYIHTYNDSEAADGLSVRNYSYRSSSPVGDGFGVLADELAKYSIGLTASNGSMNVEYSATRRIMQMCGRHDGKSGDADIKFAFLSSQEHYDGTTSSAIVGGALDFFGTDALSDDAGYDGGDVDGEYYIADSDTRLLTRDELAGYTKEELGFIRNEILARHGYPFNKEKYRDYFESTSWYVRNEGFVYSMLNEIEMKNVELIKSME